MIGYGKLIMDYEEKEKSFLYQVQTDTYYVILVQQCDSEFTLSQNVTVGTDLSKVNSFLTHMHKQCESMEWRKRWAGRVLNF